MVTDGATDDPGWQVTGPHRLIAQWASAAKPLAVAALAQTDQPLRCGGTWAVGLDLLGNDPSGGVGGVAFPWSALPLLPEPLHRAQLSVIYPGYPVASTGETPAAHRFRISRDAAHLDGLLSIGPDKRRMIKEPHRWILGIALGDCAASPLVVWDGSHLVMRTALLAALGADDPHHWGDRDVTAAYQAARAQVFATCRRVEVPIKMGQATVLHRHTLHGVAPWSAGAQAPPEGRVIAYFRPQMASAHAWLAQP